MKKVLITGANGLIGSRLQILLRSAGYEVCTIGRQASGRSDAFTWDIPAEKMDIRALEGVGTIVHLAGASIAEKRWTDDRKKEIYDSRIDATRLLYSTLAKTKHSVKTIISASAVGYYGDCGAEVLTEDHVKGEGFLAKVTADWETEVGRMEALGIRHVCCRIGIVLAHNGGALPELERTIPMGVGGYFAKDDLYYSWVHIEDVCGIMMHALDNATIQGSYNVTAPEPVLIKDLMKAIIIAKRSKAVLVPVPPFALKIALGEMSEVVLQSQRCSDKKIMDTGFSFAFPTLGGALSDIYS